MENASDHCSMNRENSTKDGKLPPKLQTLLLKIIHFFDLTTHLPRITSTLWQVWPMTHPAGVINATVSG
jgi:hypothetical protein